MVIVLAIHLSNQFSIEWLISLLNRINVSRESSDMGWDLTNYLLSSRAHFSARDWQGEDVAEVEDDVIEKEESYDSRKESELPPIRSTLCPAKPRTLDSGGKRKFK